MFPFIFRLAWLFPFLALRHEVHAAQPAGWDAASAILERIKAPVFPDRDFEVAKFGARGDGATDCHKAFADAIAACAKAGGGRVVAPAGNYLCNGPIHLMSNVNLHLAEGCTISFGTASDDYLVGDKAKNGCVLVRWEGTRCYNYSPLIYAFKQTNIALTGNGTLDGQAGKGWAAWRDRQGAAQGKLRGMGEKGVPVEQRIFGAGSFLRPQLAQFYDCANVLIEGVLLKSTPFWTLNPVLCTNVTVRGVTVKGETINDDGCDPESCTDVLIDGCEFETHDDNIAIKAGRDADGWAENGGRPCENIVIRHCDFIRGTPGGVSIGSEMSGGVRNVFVEKCTMKNVSHAFYVKSNPDRGGVVESLWVRDVAVGRCSFLFKCEMNYKGKMTGPFPPLFRDFHLERVTCQRANSVVDCAGLPGHPIQNVSMKNVTVTESATPLKLANAEGVKLENVSVNGQLISDSAPAK